MLADGQRPDFGVYRGSDAIEAHSLDRGFNDFEAHLHMVYRDVPKLDTVMAAQLERARKLGRNVTVMDLGGGSGNFCREFLVDQSLGIKTRRLLNAKATQELHLYSVTDAPTAQDHLRITPFAEAEQAGNTNITAAEVRYAITSSQSIERLLREIGETGIDVVTASNFLQYLRPTVFEKVLQNVVDTLHPGGVFMAFGYASLPRRVFSLDDGQLEVDAPVVFADPSGNNSVPVSSEVLRSEAQALLADAETSDERLLAEINRLQEVMFSTNYYLQAGFRTNVRIALKRGIKRGESPRNQFTDLIQNILPIAEDRARIIAMQHEKDAILEEVGVRNVIVADVKYRRTPDIADGLEAIIIRKRLAGHRLAKAVRRENSR